MLVHRMRKEKERVWGSSDGPRERMQEQTRSDPERFDGV